jgi:UDP-N-acetylmuramate-alanine ligase
LEVAQEGDLVLTLGAGNVWQAGDLVLAGLQQGGNVN